MGNRRLLVWCGSGLILATAAQAAFLLGGGFAARIPAAALALARQADGTKRFRFPPHHCFLIDGEPVSAFDARHCLASVPGKRDWLLVGDSHAAMLWGWGGRGAARRQPAGGGFVRMRCAAGPAANRPYLRRPDASGAGRSSGDGPASGRGADFALAARRCRRPAASGTAAESIGNATGGDRADPGVLGTGRPGNGRKPPAARRGAAHARIAPASVSRPSSRSRHAPC